MLFIRGLLRVSVSFTCGVIQLVKIEGKLAEYCICWERFSYCCMFFVKMDLLVRFATHGFRDDEKIAVSHLKFP